MVTILIPKEQRIHEKRIAATPETVEKLIALGARVIVEQGAGLGSFFLDKAYQDAGAEIARDTQELYGQGGDKPIILKVQRPLLKSEGGMDEMTLIPDGAFLVGTLSYRTSPDHETAYRQKKMTVAAMELVPRITRAQSMDVLSSQSNLAGYKAVLEGAHLSTKIIPMMMTAAGTITPARVLVIGAGVAGLQAIATAKRLGAVVSAFDVRAAAKEQVESLGGKFIEVAQEQSQGGETAGGYARDMDDAYKARQAQLLADTVKTMDLVITTALIPGRPAPLLITKEMVSAMRPGTVVVDMASEMGGNCEETKDGQIIDVGGVLIYGASMLPSLVSRDASPLYSRNIFHFIDLLWNKEAKILSIPWEDEIVQATLVLKDGEPLITRSSS